MAKFTVLLTTLQFCELREALAKAEGVDIFEWAQRAEKRGLSFSFRGYGPTRGYTLEGDAVMFRGLALLARRAVAARRGPGYTALMNATVRIERVLEGRT